MSSAAVPSMEREHAPHWPFVCAATPEASAGAGVVEPPWRRAPGPAEPHPRPFRVLVAEDDAEMRSLVSDVLRGDGYEVIEAEHGGRLLVDVAAQLKAEGSAVNEALDLIVSDIRMPICTGLQILSALREAHLTLPVILMTAFGDDTTRTQAESLGAVLFDKPFDLDDLRTAVANLLPHVGSAR
jgi:CheY-like chemotaxis protein